MRNFGAMLIVAGIVGYIYCSDQLTKLEPVPEETSIGKSLEYPAGKFEVGRYAAVAGAFCGLLLAMYPQGR